MSARTLEELLREQERRIRSLERRLGEAGSGGARWAVPFAVEGGTFDPDTGLILLEPGSRDWLIDGVFSPRHRAYRVLGQFYTPVANGASSTLRHDGTPITANVNAQIVWGDGATPHAQVQAGTNMMYPAVSSPGHHFDLLLYDPATIAKPGESIQKRYTWTWGGYPHILTTGAGGIGGADGISCDGFEVHLSSRDAAHPGIAPGGWMTVVPIA